MRCKMKSLVPVVLLDRRVLSRRSDSVQRGYFISCPWAWGRLLCFQGLQGGAEFRLGTGQASRSALSLAHSPGFAGMALLLIHPFCAETWERLNSGLVNTGRVLLRGDCTYLS